MSEGSVVVVVKQRLKQPYFGLCTLVIKFAARWVVARIGAFTKIECMTRIVKGTTSGIAVLLKSFIECRRNFEALRT